MTTMSEIDRARSQADKAIQYRRDCLYGRDGEPCPGCVEYVEAAEAFVLVLLGEYWQQEGTHG